MFSDTMDPLLSNFTPMDLLNATEDSSLCNSMPINLRVRETNCAWSERKGLLLDCSIGAKENRSEGDQSRPR